MLDSDSRAVNPKMQTSPHNHSIGPLPLVLPSTQAFPEISLKFVKLLFYHYLLSKLGPPVFQLTFQHARQGNKTRARSACLALYTLTQLLFMVLGCVSKAMTQSARFETKLPELQHPLERRPLTFFVAGVSLTCVRVCTVERHALCCVVGVSSVSSTCMCVCAMRSTICLCKQGIS